MHQVSVTHVLFAPAPYYKLNKGFFLGFLLKLLGGLRPPRVLNKKASEKYPLFITYCCSYSPDRYNGIEQLLNHRDQWQFSCHQFSCHRYWCKVTLIHSYLFVYERALNKCTYNDTYMNCKFRKLNPSEMAKSLCRLLMQVDYTAVAIFLRCFVT